VSHNGSRANGSPGSSAARSAGRPWTGSGIERHRVHLSGGRDSPAGARAAIDLLTVEAFDEIACEQLRLMVSELVANSVLHGGALTGADSIELLVLVSEAAIRVECSDPLAGFDVPANPDGYGLGIIESVASDWGVRHGELGATWFEYPRDTAVAA
jgi:anti-sigma regulatory factor (Ser/Thr protein kinase)